MEDLIQKLRGHGIAVTPQRLAILASLQRRHDHPSAEKIYQEVRPQLPAISFNTVYKTLEILCRKGLILKVNPLHEAARYDGKTGRHAHLVCRRCHTIADLHRQPEVPADLDKKDKKDAAEIQGFRVEYQSLTLWGLCPQCRKQEGRKGT
ncbi:MAG: transcriptional repressor [Desulfobaccales bacterium]|jgi:Fe2+ or Zn2+ uptake regulation protein